MTLGHEFSGTIEELGEGVDSERLKVGAKVCMLVPSPSVLPLLPLLLGRLARADLSHRYSEPVISCLECRPCMEGNRPLCEKGIGFVGYNRPGGLAPYTNVPQANLHVVPDHVGRELISVSPLACRDFADAVVDPFSPAPTVDVAALAEPLSVAWHAVSCSNIKPGETALVIGAGPIGALVTR